MLTSRVVQLAAPAAAAESRSQAFEFDIVYPPPRTPNLPATAGNARMAATADPPLRFRSTPQPQRMTAGCDSAYRRAERLGPPTQAPAASPPTHILPPPSPRT